MSRKDGEKEKAEKERDREIYCQKRVKQHYKLKYRGT